MDNERRHHHHQMSEQEVLIMFLVFGAVCAIGAGFWVLRYVYLIPTRLVVAMFGSAVIGLYACFEVIYYFATKKSKIEKEWPRRRPFVSTRDRIRHFESAQKARMVYLGTDSMGKPFFWTEQERVQQTIVLGSSGSGKTSLLENILQQDIAAGHPVIFLDGKGELKLFDRVQQWAAACGRIQDLHLISPEQAEFSSVYNPCQTTMGQADANFSFIFDSFSDNGNPFFDAVQRDFLLNIGNVLSFCGKPFNFKDIMVCAQEPDQLLKILQMAESHVRSLPHIDKYTLDQFRLSQRVLFNGLSDENQMYNIKNLITKLTQFLSKDMALLTGGYERMITLDEVLDKKQILFVSLNINIKASATEAIGKMLLSNLQLVIGRRYANTAEGTKHPFASIIFDEFAPFAYTNFARILQTVRGSRCAMILALQSINQLESVSKEFAKEVSAAPNNKLILKISDDSTAEFVTKASGLLLRHRPTFQFRKTGLFNNTIKEQETGTLSNVRESVIEDQWVKYQPVGQCEFLRASPTRGFVHHHVHINPPFEGTVSVVPSDVQVDADTFSGIIPGAPVPVFVPITAQTTDGLNLQYGAVDVLKGTKGKSRR